MIPDGWVGPKVLPSIIPRAFNFLWVGFKGGGVEARPPGVPVIENAPPRF